jgi:hypothetical protein
LLRAAPAWSLIRKTSLQDRTDNPLRSSNGLTKHFRAGHLAVSNTIMPGVRTGRGLVHVVTGKPMTSYDHDRYSERSSLHDVRQHAPPQFSRAFKLSRAHNAYGHEFHFFGRAFQIPTGGARRDRTDDLLLAKQALSQLSYGPSSRAARTSKLRSSEGWWAWEDLNFRPHAYQARALTN